MLYSLEACFPNCGRSLSASQLGCQLSAWLAASLSSPFCCPTPSLWKAKSALGEGPGGLWEMCLASLSHLCLWSARVVHQMIWGSLERGSQLFCSPSSPQDLCFPLTEEIFSLPGLLLRLQRLLLWLTRGPQNRSWILSAPALFLAFTYCHLE